MEAAHLEQEFIIGRIKESFYFSLSPLLSVAGRAAAFWKSHRALKGI
jgi:hypothetical protein